MVCDGAGQFAGIREFILHVAAVMDMLQQLRLQLLLLLSLRLLCCR